MKSTTANLHFNHLPRFASWIMENRLDEYSRLILDLSRQEDIPILKFLSEFSDEQLQAMGKVSGGELLSMLANNKALEHIDNTVREWVTNRLDMIDRDSIVAEDIGLISLVRRQVFRLLLGEYATSIPQFGYIMEEVDRFTTASDIAGFNAYIRIRQEKMQALLENIREQEENLIRLIDNAPDAVIVIDEHSIIRLWNPKAESIFGWKSDETLGRPLTDTIVPEQYREAHNRGMHHYLETGKGNVINRTTEITAMNSRNEEIFISLTISETMQKGHRAFIAFLRDVTQERQTQIELSNKSLLLERKNQELEHSNQELESFNYVASHDLQEPLRKIKIFANRMLEEESELSPQLEGYVQKIISSSAHMQNLIDDLLEFSQTTSPDELSELVEVTDLVKEAESILAHDIEETGAQVSYTSLPVIRVVSFQFQQVFINLISNAIKYRKPNSKPSIRISAVIASSNELDQDPNIIPGNYLKISVADNGIGFDPKFSTRLFDLFARLHNKDKYIGTGIGLAICKKIVHNHHGMLRAESDGHSGAAFHIYLPQERIV